MMPKLAPTIALPAVIAVKSGFAQDTAATLFPLRSAAARPDGLAERAFRLAHPATKPSKTIAARCGKIQRHNLDNMAIGRMSAMGSLFIGTTKRNVQNQIDSGFLL
jgi:hypothetical protein